MKRTGRPSRRDFVDRPERQAVSVGERQVLVDPGPAGKAGGVQLPRREHDLPVLPVDRVPIVVHAGEVVVGADLLELAERVEQRPLVPQRDVLDRRGIALEVGARQPRIAGQPPLLDPIQRERVARGLDVVHDERRLAHLLVRRDDEPLDDRRIPAPAERGPPDTARPQSRAPADAPRSRPARCVTAAPASAATMSTRSAGIRACTSAYDAPATTPDGVVSSWGICSQAPKASTISSTVASVETCRTATAEA